MAIHEAVVVVLAVLLDLTFDSVTCNRCSNDGDSSESESSDGDDSGGPLKRNRGIRRCALAHCFGSLTRGSAVTVK